MRTTKEPSLGDLFNDLSSEVSGLVRQELELAKLELSEKARRIGGDVAILAIGGAILYAGFLALIAAVIVGLGLIVESMVLSALIVAVVVLGGGYYCVRQGLNSLKQDNLAPRETLDSLELNLNWAKDQFR
ncbi:MAG TPA: phage holin family protein [Chloroflexota bacterium]|nr:phage holin family protein [Chloroflexota bacterium]